MSRIPRLRTHPGVNVTLQGGARTLERFVDSRIAAANGPRLVQVTRGCDGQPTQHLLSDLQCNSNGAGTIQIALPTWNGVTERQFNGNAGRQPIIGVSSPIAPCSPTPAEREAARRYQDSEGNLWDYQGNWISAGHGAPALVASYFYIATSGDVPIARIYRSSDSVFRSIWAGETKHRSGERIDGRTYPYPLRDYALLGTCSSGTCGRFISTDYVFCVEFYNDPAYGEPGSPTTLIGPITVVRAASNMAFVADYQVGATPYSLIAGIDWAIDVADDGTWIIHKIATAAGTVTTDIYRFAFDGTSILYLGTVRIVNDGSGGKAAATTGMYFKQVA